MTICLRQSVTSATSPRSRTSECASSARLASIEARISCGLRVAGGGHQIVRSGVSELTVSLMRLASSMARSGVGGAPRLNARAARKPASAPNRKRMPATMKKPQNCVPLGNGIAQ